MNDASKQERSGDEVVAELVALSARIDAALQRQLALIREIHERELWFIWGVRTCAQWLERISKPLAAATRPQHAICRHPLSSKMLGISSPRGRTTSRTESTDRLAMGFEMRSGLAAGSQPRSRA